MFINCYYLKASFMEFVSQNKTEKWGNQDFQI